MNRQFVEQLYSAINTALYVRLPYTPYNGPLGARRRIQHELPAN